MVDARWKRICNLCPRVGGKIRNEDKIDLPHFRNMVRTRSSALWHYSGLPPEVTGGVGKRAVIGFPVLLVLEERADGIFLFRFGADGVCVGDTWHASVEDAKQQTVYEYKDSMTGWIDVPETVQDAIRFRLNLITKA